MHHSVFCRINKAPATKLPALCFILFVPVSVVSIISVVVIVIVVGFGGRCAVVSLWSAVGGSFPGLDSMFPVLVMIVAPGVARGWA